MKLPIRIKSFLWLDNKRISGFVFEAISLMFKCPPKSPLDFYFSSSYQADLLQLWSRMTSCVQISVKIIRKYFIDSFRHIDLTSHMMTHLVSDTTKRKTWQQFDHETLKYFNSWVKLNWVCLLRLFVCLLVIDLILIYLFVHLTCFWVLWFHILHSFEQICFLKVYNLKP